MFPIGVQTSKFFSKYFFSHGQRWALHLVFHKKVTVAETASLIPLPTSVEKINSHSDVPEI